MRLSVFLFGLILSGCNSTPLIDRPNPDFVVKFDDDKKFNNSPFLQKEFEAANKVLLVGVSDKYSAKKTSEDLLSIVDTFDDNKDVYIAYRITNLPTETRIVEIFDASHHKIPVLLANLSSGSLDQYGRFFSETEMRRFESALYSKSVTLTDYFSVQGQLADLLKNFGWILLDSGQFMDSDNAKYLPKNIELNVTTLEPMKATKVEIRQLIKAWSSHYNNLFNGYQFSIDIATQTVTYEKIPTLSDQAKELINAVL